MVIVLLLFAENSVANQIIEFTSAWRVCKMIKFHDRKGGTIYVIVQSITWSLLTFDCVNMIFTNMIS